MNRYIKSTRELNLSVLKQTFKGETMYTITNDQLKAINKALRLCEELIEAHTEDPFTLKNDSSVIEAAYLALDTVYDNQEVSQW